MNFAANMGDNARIPVEKKYKPRIVPETTSVICSSCICAAVMNTAPRL